MILNIVIFKNMKIDAFTQPQFIDIEPKKAAIQLVRSMKVSPDKATPYQNLCMYDLGTFDDETGKFELYDEPVFLVDLRETWKGLENEFLCKTKDDEKDSVGL